MSETDGTPMLDIRGIHTYYGDSYVLQGVDMSVHQGQVVALLGRNGVGKTTTVRSIAGFTPPRRGDIEFMGQQIARQSAQAISKAGISVVPQGRRVFGSLTVKEHLTIFRRDGTGKGWNLDRVVAVFPRLGERLRNRGTALSGGEQQMLAIGRALVTNPQLLVVDELTEGLSPVLVETLGRAIRDLKESENQTILLIEQNVNMALSLADYVYVMNKGTIVFHGTPDQLIENPEIQHTYLGV